MRPFCNFGRSPLDSGGCFRDSLPTSMILTNPLGLLALLGIPAVLLIHFLQRQARVIPISTLFLLEQHQRESTSGRRFDRLTPSIPLWLQLLIVLLLTWLLTQPRYPKATSVQQIAIVVDSSASMAVFQDKLVTELAESLPRLQGPASDLQLYLLPSDPNVPALYTGSDIDEALAELRSWRPTTGALDPTPALRLARSRIRTEGLLIYASDRDDTASLPFDAQLLAVGEATPNIGFTGMSFPEDGKSWQATVRNYSDTATETTWSVRFPDGSETTARPITLSPNGLTTLTGTLPEGVSELTVRLAGDAFTQDDILPLVVPRPKELLTRSTLPPKFADFQDRFFAFFPHLKTDSEEQPDLTLAAYDPLFPLLPDTNAIITIDESVRSRKFLSGGIVPEPHPLTEGLSWQALQSRETVAFPILATDQILLWQGQRPLILLREVAARPATDTEAARAATSNLIFNFDLSLSNALKLPSTVILLHRFASSLREEKVAFEALNTETNQPLSLALREAQPVEIVLTKEGSPDVATTLPATAQLRAPIQPSHFQVRQAGEVLLSAASFFADTREADLRQASSANRLQTTTIDTIQRHTTEDHLWPLWTLLTLAAVTLAWFFTKDRPKDDSKDDSKKPSFGPPETATD